MAESAYVVTDLSFGDAGKGTTVDYLVRQAQSAIVVKHTGGAQCLHNVVTTSGFQHVFAQFGSGSLVRGVKTFLAKDFLVSPTNMMREAQALREIGVRDAWERTSIDQTAKLITPWQVAANQVRELARGDNRHGSCGQGIGETQADSLLDTPLVIRAGDVTNSRLLEQKLRNIRDAKHEQLLREVGSIPADKLEIFTDQELLEETVRLFKYWADKLKIVDETYLAKLEQNHDMLVFEGGQGVLLDEWYGFHPYTTWSTTTHENAVGLLERIDFQGQVTRLGIIRSYTTRHGAGPFVTEDTEMSINLPDSHNGTGQWQGSFRVGHLDLVAHRYALAACGETDGLVVTQLDRIGERDNWQYCNKYKLEQSSEVFSTDSEGSMVDIELGTRGDLDYQEKITKSLPNCQPVYRRLETAGRNRVDELLGTIEDELCLPVTVASFGPTAADKRVLTPGLIY